jgi:hypothetical protein
MGAAEPDMSRLLGGAPKASLGPSSCAGSDTRLVLYLVIGLVLRPAVQATHPMGLRMHVSALRMSEILPSTQPSRQVTTPLFEGFTAIRDASVNSP